MPEKFKTSFIIDVYSINNDAQNRIKFEVKNNKNPQLTEFEKEIEVIKKDKTSTYLIKDETDISEENIYLYLLNSSQSTQSTCDNSKTSTNYESYSNLSIDSNDNINENIFNYARANFCLRYRLYDFSLKEENIEFNYPPKYKINDEFSAYVYPNEITTFAFSISGFLLNDNMNIDLKLIKNNDNNRKYYKLLGLYFCGNEIILKNGNRKCSPNDFMCKNCMEYNKKIYNLKNKHFININGRVSKINKGSYHCFGHFSVNDKLEECITKFTCEACKLINLNTQYYI